MKANTRRGVVRVYTLMVTGLVASFLGTTAAWGEPTATVWMRLTDPNDTSVALPVGAGGAVHLVPGQQFRVVVGVHIDNPNVVGQTRPAAVRGLPLGLQSLAANIVTVAAGSPMGTLGDASTAGAIVPVIGGWGSEFPVPQWAGYEDSYPSDLEGGPWINLLDWGSDGDLDPSGAGVVQMSKSIPSTTAALAKFQYGAAGTDRYNVDLFSGLFEAGPNVGQVPVELRTVTTSLVLQYDDGQPGFFRGMPLRLSGIMRYDGVIIEAGGSVDGAYFDASTFSLVPEPSVAGVGCVSAVVVGLVRRRRA